MGPRNDEKDRGKGLKRAIAIGYACGMGVKSSSITVLVPYNFLLSFPGSNMYAILKF